MARLDEMKEVDNKMGPFICAGVTGHKILPGGFCINPYIITGGVRFVKKSQKVAKSHHLCKTLHIALFSHEGVKIWWFILAAANSAAVLQLLNVYLNVYLHKMRVAMTSLQFS